MALQGGWPMNFKLSQIVILNESSFEHIRGDVSIHQTIEAARSYVELVDVLNHEYFGYQVDGTRLHLAVMRDEVVISVAPGAARDPGLVRRLLEEAASFVSDSSNGKTDRNLKGATIESLVELIGFTQ
jgi:hypothetical protein